MSRFDTDAQARWNAIRDAKREGHVQKLAHIDARAIAKGLHGSSARVRQHMAADELYLANVAVDLRAIALRERRRRWRPLGMLLTDARLARWCNERLADESEWLRSLSRDRFREMPADQLDAYYDWLKRLRSRQARDVRSKLHDVAVA
jgi:hypothetical protein